MAAGRAILTGTHQVRMEFAGDGGGLSKGGNVTLDDDGQKVGVGHVEQTVPMICSADETTAIGRESRTPVSADDDCHSSVFTGKSNGVQIDLGLERSDHLSSSQERRRIAMAQQYAIRSDGSVRRGAREAWSWSWRH